MGEDGDAPVVGRRLASPGQPLPRMEHGRRLSDGGTVAPMLLRGSGLLYSPNCSFTMNLTVQALAVDKQQLEDKTVHLAVVVSCASVARWY